MKISYALSRYVCIGAGPLLARTPIPAAIALDRAAAARAGVSAEVLNLALSAVTCGVTSGELATPATLTLIDYSLPSTQPRLWVFDLRSGRMLFKELVAHGRNSGNMRRVFPTSWSRDRAGMFDGET